MHTDTKISATVEVASMSKRQFAARHNLSQRTLDNLRLQGLPVWVLSRRKILFPVAECDAWMRDRFAVSARRRPTMERLARAASAGGAA